MVRARLPRFTPFAPVLLIALLIAVSAEPQNKKRRVITLETTEGWYRPLPVMRRQAALLVEPFRECAANSMAQAPDSAMILELALDFGPNGNVTKVEAAASENTPTDVTACAKRRARRLVVDPPDGGIGHATQTYLLLPASRVRAGQVAPRSAPRIDVEPTRRSDVTAYAPAPVIVIPLEPPVTDPVARLALDLRARVEACTESIPDHTGSVTLRFIVHPNGDANDVSLDTDPQEARLAECLRKSLNESRLSTHPGARAFQVALRFAIDQRGVSLVR